MSEKKMTDEELAKISGAGEKTATPPKIGGDPELPDDSSGGGHGDVDTETPPADPADINQV